LISTGFHRGTGRSAQRSFAALGVEAVDQARHGVLWRVVDEHVYVFGLAVHFDQLSLEVAPGWWFYPSGSLKRTFHRLVQPDISCANDDANEYWTYSHKNSSLAHFSRGNADTGRL